MNELDRRSVNSTPIIARSFDKLNETEVVLRVAVGLVLLSVVVKNGLLI